MLPKRGLGYVCLLFAAASVAAGQFSFSNLG